MLLLIAASPLTDPSAACMAAEKPAKVSLRLKTSAHVGYVPLQVTLSGKLLGANEEDLATCQFSELWTSDNPGSSPFPSSTKKYLPCVTALVDGKVPRSFQRKVTLKEPGTYSYHLLLTPKGQRTKASKAIEIKAVRSRFHVKATQTDQ